MVRKLNKEEMEDNYRRATTTIFDKLCRQCHREILPLAKLEHELTNQQIWELQDQATMSIVANFIVWSVHPLARNKFLEHLNRSVNLLADVNTHKDPITGKIHVN